MANTELLSSETEPEYDVKEGRLARSIEKQTAKIPSDVFLWGAAGAIGLSLITQVVEGRRTGLKMMQPRAPMSTFIGLWAPTLLLLGVYNKLVKVAGHDRTDRGNSSGEDVDMQH
ncbi:MAG: hypothetical protein K1X64_02555 [Myxococcaceae bacterium]|nr:hypothetical protein [Myxococcaceae bacterium]